RIVRRPRAAGRGSVELHALLHTPAHGPTSCGSAAQCFPAGEVREWLPSILEIPSRELTMRTPSAAGSAAVRTGSPARRRSVKFSPSLLVSTKPSRPVPTAPSRPFVVSPVIELFESILIDFQLPPPSGLRNNLPRRRPTRTLPPRKATPLQRDPE